MIGAEDKTLLCFCHWGRKNKVLPDGSISYGGGITDQVIVKTGIKYNDFVNAVFDRLGIDPSGRILHFTVKFDRSDLVRLRDQKGVDTLLQFNDGFAHVYVSSLEEEPNSRLPSGHAEKVVLVGYSDSEADTTPAGDDENELASPLKKARFQSAGDSKPLKKATANQSAKAGDGKPQQNETVGGDNQKHAGAAQKKLKVELIVNSDSRPSTIPDNNPPKVYDYPDPEFRDFGKHKSEIYFAVDQIWACHDADFMPRFYARIRKVSSPEFKIKLRWLEAHPEDERERAWVRADLPVSCGKFRRGSSKYTSDRLIFSHQMQCEKDKRGLYIVYPRKGETWALFKDWDIRWSSDPKSYRKYKYEIVEVLSDFVGDAGIQVGYLEKVTGFISIFQRTRQTVVGAFFVKPKELYKFSHRIPSKMSGTEREDVPG
ncbi:hypothetical protein MTR67_005251 [Solanum verrucosum]|uniref:DUF3444 domain-containing protein n=1 Tax=Solanum verrucosum TaxID=315347 RepID=A0AAF0PVY2_SOLVR|nr:hypothetical protein MTR67_005246 [Solanum verrucosum]WMV11866.1 hypothetical protein MTR67_005251 [Solanum verrucosum]